MLEVMDKDLSRRVQEARLFLFPVQQTTEINISGTADPEPTGRIQCFVRVTSPPSQMFFNE